MITEWTIYWITRLDTINGSAKVVVITGCAISAIGLFAWGMIRDSIATADEPRLDAWMKWGYKRLFWVLLIAFPVLLFTPTSKEAAAIIVLPRIINNQDVQALGADLPKLAREWLEKSHPTQK